VAEHVSAWFDSLPEDQRDQLIAGIVSLDGSNVTPREVVKEIQNGTALGDALLEQAMTLASLDSFSSNTWKA
tara:strand:+ start:252340 stop:252555 length:216 start_codon:yes stop_codon:yes gene_type:complete